MAYPTTIDTFTNPQSTNYLSDASVLHATQHTSANNSVVQIESKLGVDGSAVTTSVDYLLKNTASVNPGHKHNESGLTFGNFTTNNVTTGQHGLAPISPNLTTQFLNGGNPPAYAQVKDSDLSISNVTTNNVTSGTHGFVPAASDNASQFLNNGNPPLFATASAQLASSSGVALSTSTATTLYTVPTGRTAIIEQVVVRNANTNLTTASYSFGFNSASFNDVIADATHTELTTNTLYTVLNSKAGAAIGAAGAAFSLKANTTQTTATVTVDTYGYLF